MMLMLLSPLGRAGLAVAGVLVFLSWFAFDQQSKGAAKVVAKIEKATNVAVSKAQSAGRKSISKTETGSINPNYRD